MSIAIEAAELMELFQWQTTEAAWQVKETDALAEVKDELADVLIYCLSLANQLDIDVSQAVTEKMQRNCLRFPAQSQTSP